MVYIFLTTGFEEIEALATVDVLRRAGLQVRTVSLTGSRTVTASHGVPVVADILFEAADFADARLLVVPGGTPAYAAHEGLRAVLLAHHARSGMLAAICAAPMVFGQLGLLEGRRATCYPGFEQHLHGAELCCDEPVVVDGDIVTGRGPGLSLDFALTLVERLAGRERRDEVASAMLING